MYLGSHLVICLPQNTRTSLIRFSPEVISLPDHTLQLRGNIWDFIAFNLYILVMGACLFNMSKKKAFHRVHISLASRAIFLISSKGTLLISCLKALRLNLL